MHRAANHPSPPIRNCRRSRRPDFARLCPAERVALLLLAASLYAVAVARVAPYASAGLVSLEQMRRAS